MKTLIYIEHEEATAETVCRFANKFSELPKDTQLQIAIAARERMETLVSSLEAIIARSSAGGS